MNRVIHWKKLTVFVAASTLMACSSDDQTASQSESDSVDDNVSSESAPATAAVRKPGTAELAVSPGKITAPISIDYSIVGNPIVGQPVSIDLQISSPLNDRPITVHYRVNEAGSLTFPETQLRTMALSPQANRAVSRSQQVTVVPQREGRLYLLVSAEIETDSGTMIRSMSIPIQVGRAARVPTTNGELVEGPDGEVGISMPAKEQ
jgi:hypothetical protein